MSRRIPTRRITCARDFYYKIPAPPEKIIFTISIPAPPAPIETFTVRHLKNNFQITPSSYTNTQNNLRQYINVEV